MKRQTRVGAMVALLVVASALSAAAQGSGAISGVVLDEAGLLLPGVTVTLSNPTGVIGSNQETTSDGRGVYQFSLLVSGTYIVTAQLVGFSTTSQEGIIVNADVTARADLTLVIGNVEETITVTGQTPLLDTQSTLRQTVMTRDLIETLPARQDIWAMARTAPAVVMTKYDVGGSEMFAQTLAIVHGSAAAERTHMIDGMEVTWAGGEGTVISYFDAHAYEEVNFQTSGGSAEYGKGGPVTNMITRTGTNQFHGEYSFTGGGSGTASNNLPAEHFNDLLAVVPARALATNPGLVPSAEMLGVYDNSMSLGGPIVQNKLWYTLTTSLVTLRQYRLGSYNIDGTRVLESNRMRNVQAKFSWQAAATSQLHFMFNFNEKRVYFRPNNTGPSSDFIETDAMTSQRISSPLYQAKWTSVLRGDMLFETSASLLTGEEHGRPVPGVQPGTLPTFDAVTREHRGAVPSYLNRPSTRVSWLAGLTFLQGSHDIKVGYQLQWRKHGDTHNSFISPYGFNGEANGFRAVFRDGVPDSVNTYNTPTTFEMFARDHAMYIQDRWTPTPKLTFNLGLRVEKLYAWQPEVCQVETLFIAGECFPAIEGAPDFTAPSPRFGMIYDFFGDGRTAAKITINRFNQPIGVSHIRSFLNPVRRVSDTRAWVDANGDLFPQLDELGPSTGFNLGTTNRFADNLNWPTATEYSVGIEHQLPGNMVIGATYIHRRRRDEVGSRNLAVPTDSYTPIQVTEVGTGWEGTVFNLDPTLRGVFDRVYDNRTELDATFNGVDLTFNKRLSNGWMVMGGLSLGDTDEDIYGATRDLNDPNNLFRRGLNRNDVPVAFKAFGLYELPYEISLSASFQHFTGFPERNDVRVSSSTVALTQVAQVLTIEPRGTTRLEDVNMLDISLRKTVRSGRYEITPIVDIFNAFNGAPIKSRTTRLGATFGRVRDIQRGRIIKFGLLLDF
jgi:hypothetical protein